MSLLDQVSRTALDPALAVLPKHLDSDKARVLLLAIGLQESRLTMRRQMLDGPARGLWQFEPGSKASKGGVWGVYLHSQTMELLRVLCRSRSVGFEPRSIWTAIETDDVLAAGLARLLIWTDPKPLPAVDDEVGAWELYANRCWRPGKPHPETWPDCHKQAREYVFGGA